MGVASGGGEQEVGVASGHKNWDQSSSQMETDILPEAFSKQKQHMGYDIHSLWVTGIAQSILH